MLENKTTSKGANLLFSGTQEKCVACGKTVYLIEKVIILLPALFLSLSCKGWYRPFRVSISSNLNALCSLQGWLIW